MDYLTYAEYKSYGGKLPETAFSRLEYKAEKKIDRMTYNRLRNEASISNNVKRLVFEIIGIMNNTDYSNESYVPAIVHEENDGYSVSCDADTVMSISQSDMTINQTIIDYLSFERTSAGILLLYCGVR